MGFFELALGLLFVLAVLDLSVGVSNDAVNFLNSAIGSRVTSRRVILLIAGLGVLVGATLSSGIMEVARKGIFNPEMFVFADVMVIFLAVMLADVLLLDLFNTLGLPTSTTVSIVFELLGAAVAVAMLAVAGSPDGGNVVDYVNVSQAILIISGIGISIVLAFILGTVVQFLSRMLFTFQEKNHTHAIRIGWSAIAFTIISVFLIVKGLKGASFISSEDLAFVHDNAVVLTFAALAFWTVVMGILNHLQVNLLAIVVLGGTFSLALAFASNDLVNFIGVPLAGLSAWEAWSGSGIPADQLAMHALTEPVQGNTLILLGAGVVMVLTLWLSSKARSVTQTEVNLARQGDGVERFKPGPVSRGIVRAFATTGHAAMQAVPDQWRTGLAARFQQDKVQRFELDQPAFDTLRASVNLTVASILIVVATSMKLPLSTTFVSFMVAMGTSLADRAWGRDTAVYRLAGVFSVIGGWFATAVSAFLMAALFATIIRLFGGYAVATLVVLASAALIHSYRYHDKRSKMQQIIMLTSPDKMDRDALTLRRHLSDALLRNGEVVDKALTMLVQRKRKMAKKLRASVKADAEATQDTETEFVQRLNRVKPRIEPWLLDQLDVLACDRDMLQSASTLAKLASEHILNEHSAPTARVAAGFTTLQQLFRNAFSHLAGAGDSSHKRSSKASLQEIDGELNSLTSRVLEELYAGHSSTRNTTLLLGIVLELREMHRELERVAAWQ